MHNSIHIGSGDNVNGDVTINCGNVSINGKVYHGNNVSMKNGVVTVDGVVQDGGKAIEEKKITITIHGDCGDIQLGNGVIQVEGDAGDIETTNGAVSVAGDVDDVSTVNGAITVRGSCKKAKSVNGRITHG